MRSKKQCFLNCIKIEGLVDYLVRGISDVCFVQIGEIFSL